MSEKRCRAFMITGNNPDKYYEWTKIDYTTATEADYERMVENAIQEFVKGDKNHEDRDPAINGAVGVFEVGERGTPHFHLFVSSKNPMRFKALQKRYPHSDIAVLRGTVLETLDYLHKRRKHKDKSGTLRCQPVYWGECFVDNRGVSGNKVFDAIEEMLEDGYTPVEVFFQSVKYSYYAGAVERTNNARRVSEIPHYQTVFVEFHVGKAGTGKTYEYLKMCQQGLADEIYLVSGDYKNPWDGYDLAKHSILFLDELRGSSFSTSTLLGIADGYKMTLSARYSNRYKNWGRVVISTVVPPEELFSDSFVGMTQSGQDSFEQFKRRLDIVVYHYVNEFLEGDAQYRTITVPAVEYTKIRQLEEMASQEILREAKKYGQQELFDRDKSAE